LAAASPAWAQSTIYKLVDDQGHVTYSNKPMKGAAVVDLEPLTTIPATPAGMLQPQKASLNTERIEAPRSESKPAVATVTPLPATPSLAAVEPQVQRRRDDERRKILEDELSREQESLDTARGSLSQEQQNPQLVAAVRAAQQASEPSASQLVEFRNAIDKASGRIRGLQATVAEHEKNIEALKKELGALKP
jgi:predicted  nucleic acid-binding Zn-ribbon protein